MKFNIIPKPETRKFNYKPQFYTPKEEKSTVAKEGYNPGEFAERLHRTWNSRRQRKEKMLFPLTLVIIMLFFAFMVGYVYFKFFMK